MQNKILLLGSGYVAGPCLEYLLRNPNNHITIACRTLQSSKELSKSHPQTTPISLDVENANMLRQEIKKCDLVISLIPYIHHCKVIKIACEEKKHVVTTSYVSEEMKSYDALAKSANITVLNEIGVDPGIDHLYAIKNILEIHEEKGKIVSFTSYCGGLPAPECSNNPLGYKFSWSSRGVLLALRNTAKYLQDGKVQEIPGPQLMSTAKPLYIYPAFAFEGYPNRDSTPYSERYNIPEAKTIIRGTLRYQGFPTFVRALVCLGFLDDKRIDLLDEKTRQAVSWLELVATLLSFPGAANANSVESFMKDFLLNKSFSVQQVDRILHGMRWLGFFSDEPVAKRGNCLDTLCAKLEEKMKYQKGERDMVMLQHCFQVEFTDGRKQTRTSTGLWFGEPEGASAMATTVGVPCGVAVQLILDGKIKERGVLAPLQKDMVYTLIEELEKEGIKMIDEII